MTTKTSYIATLVFKKVPLKGQLDELIERYKCQPVGTGYIDIIVSREYYIEFINELTKFKFAIESISWWCHCTSYNEKNFGCPHGYGGPKSKYFEGWFSERSHDFDEIDQNDLGELENDFNEDRVKKINNKSLVIIKNKQTIPYADGTFHVFKRDNCLTPALWICLPADWVNNELLIGQK